MFAIIAQGPNRVKIPCLFFETEEDARDYMDNIGIVEDEDGLYKEDVDGTIVYHLLRTYNADRNERDGYEDSQFADHFFTSYYGGCGAVSRFEVVEIPYGEPIVPFSLD